MSEEIVDFRKLARAAAKARRSGCVHEWVKRKSGFERCSNCGDHYPCKSLTCEHLDCIEDGIALGLRKGFPRSFSFDVTSLNKGHTNPADDCAGCTFDMENHYWLLVDTDQPAERWILPPGWVLV